MPFVFQACVFNTLGVFYGFVKKLTEREKDRVKASYKELTANTGYANISHSRQEGQQIG